MRRFISDLCLTVLLPLWLIICAAQAQYQSFPPGTFANRAALDAAAASFSGPASFGANLIAWFKADVATFTNTGCTSAAANGNTLNCWKDQSGNGYNLNDNASCTGLGAGATLDTAVGINGKTALNFVAAGGPQAMFGKSANGPCSAGGQFNWGGASPSFSFWAAVNITTTGVNGGTMGAWQNASNVSKGAADGIETLTINTASTNFGPTWNGNTQTADHTVTAATNICYSATFDGTTFTSYIGNAGAVAHTWAVALVATPNAWGFGASPQVNDANHGVNGKLGEIVILNKSASSTDRSNMQTYLSTTRGYGC
jgi:hypothetical protein